MLVFTAYALKWNRILWSVLETGESFSFECRVSTNIDFICICDLMYFLWTSHLFLKTFHIIRKLSHFFCCNRKWKFNIENPETFYIARQKMCSLSRIYVTLTLGYPLIRTTAFNACNKLWYINIMYISLCIYIVGLHLFSRKNQQ